MRPLWAAAPSGPLDRATAEVRRIFVIPESRNHGVAGETLFFLEGIAREFGYQSLRLETGVRQPAAIRVYEKAGYARIPAYGIYRDNPLSVCFEKMIRRDFPNR
jgi:putative acetyltransferase